MHPVPGHPVTTPFGVRGSWWSCHRDTSGRGIHTGADMAAPHGARVVAARPGVARHVNYGAAFGSLQLLIVADDGTADFYAHMRTRRTTHGVRVQAGADVGTVGSEGNATGPHLHFERHTAATGWSCAIITDPAPSLAWTNNDMPLTDEDRQWIAQEIRRGVREALAGTDLSGRQRNGQWMLQSAQRNAARLAQSGE